MPEKNIPSPNIICTHCVLDSTIQGISFDEKGVCNFCNDYFLKTVAVQKPSPQYMNKALQLHLNKIKKAGQGKQYDCIIGLSGGVDSSYVAYLTKQYGLRPLAIHLDNGWNAELAVSNIEKICKKLDIDLYTYVIDWTEFKDIQVAFLKASVANAEAPTDHAIFATLYKLAKNFKVKYILDGVNSNTEYVRPGMNAGGHAYGDLTHLKAIHKKFGKQPIKTFPTMGFATKMLNQKFLGIQQFSILNFIDYNKKEATNILIEKLDWTPYDGKHHESIFTKWHQLVHLPTKFNFDKRKLHLSDLILSGQISRKEALAELATYPLSQLQKNELEEYVQKKLDLTKEEYKKILEESPRSFTDYPNSQWIMDFYKKIKK